jgi:hypothetical protein
MAQNFLKVVVDLVNLPENPVNPEENRTRQRMLAGLGKVGKIGQICWQDAEIEKTSSMSQDVSGHRLLVLVLTRPKVLKTKHGVKITARYTNKNE